MRKEKQSALKIKNFAAADSILQPQDLESLVLATAPRGLNNYKQ